MQNTITKPTVKNRIHLMDELRGVAVFCMVFYHGFYTLSLFGVKAGTVLLYFFMPAEPYFAGLFMLISGISSNLSHSNLIRGLKLLGFSLLITLITYVFIPEELIVFGILHFLSVCMILYGLLKPFADRFDFSWYAVAVCGILYLFTRGISCGYLGFAPFFRINLPSALYSTDFLAPLGIYSENFRSADYFAIFPWIFVFAAGTFLGKLATAGKFPKWFYPSRVPFFSWLGRNALIIYIVHQPIIYGICYVISSIIKIVQS